MATAGELNRLLSRLRQRAEAGRFAGAPDAELLERFRDHGDAAAFEALVRRHGPLVLAACRKVLANGADVEDAFQATFLILLRNAPSIRSRRSVGSWLYGVAHHVAVQARDAAARRQRLERRAGRPDQAPAPDLPWREACAALHEELDRLPEKYRLPLLLCYLEGLSRDEAARRLGWSPNAVRGRLERGRKLLRGRLARRGLALSAGLLAAVGDSVAASGLPPKLIQVTLQAATAGRHSPAVAALLNGAPPTMFNNLLKLTTGLVLAAGLLAGAASVRHAASAKATPTEPPAEKVNEKPLREKETVTFSGRVVDPDGKPVAGARLFVAPTVSEKDTLAGDGRPIAPSAVEKVTTGTDGRFSVSVPASDMERRAKLMAIAKGLGPDWVELDKQPESTPVTLRLVKDDVPIAGRVLDLEGRPVAGAKVRVQGVEAYPGEDLTKMLEEVRLRGGSGSAVKSWQGPLPAHTEVATAGADGRFRLAGFGRERAVWLAVEAPTIEHTPIMVMTRAGDAVLGPKPPRGSRQAKVHGATFDYLALPARPIRGVVRDKASGKAVAGATLWSHLTTHRAQTDAEGRYQLLGHPKSSTYTVYVVPPDGRHFGLRLNLSDAPGLAPLAADIALPSGIAVRGRVLDKASGKPVAGVRVSYHVLFPNSKAGRLDDYHEYGGLSYTLTGTDGSFAMTVLPGPGVLTAAAEPLSSYRPALVTVKEQEDNLGERPHRFNSQDILVVRGAGALAVAQEGSLIAQAEYNALALINPKEADKELVRDLLLLPPLTRTGTIVGPGGKPLSGVTAIGVDSSPATGGWHSTLKSANFTVRGLHPERTRQLFLHHKEKNLGRYLELRGEQSEPLKVELQPCGSVVGRIVDKDGKPVAGTVIYFCRRGYGAFWPGGFQVKTGQDGRFRAEGLVPTQKYTMTRYTTNLADTLPSEVTVEPGKTKELGDLAVAPVARLP
jgi:RNA polymerase sigma factor (sigma-70 family)